MKISAIVLTKNEEEMIEDCLESVRQLADEIVVVDSGSTDKTLEIVKKYTDKIWLDESDDFSAKRNLGLIKANGEWILYIDADERVTPELREEIESLLRQDYGGQAGIGAYEIKRKNFYLGNHEWPFIEQIERLFKKTALREWEGKIHESPVVGGGIGELNGFLLHYTHRDLSSMVQKTIEWSRIEAELRFKAGHPPIIWWRFPRVMLTAFWDSYIKQGGWKAGTVGIVESFYQAFSIFVTYTRLWELQNNETTRLPARQVKQ